LTFALRRLDHRLRLERQQSIDILERDPAKIQGIALALGYKGKKNERAGKRLLEDYEKLRMRIRACYERRFRSESKSSSAIAGGSAIGASASSGK
jgi:glutamine synthetase adenylyltransferase